MKVLVTGGAGYIGSTISSALLDNGHTPVIIDSLINGRVEYTDGRIFYKGDIADGELLEKIFNENPGIECAIHCASLILPPESVAKPYEYYYENVVKSISLFRKLNSLGCNKVVFSSSASVYGDASGFVVTEDSPVAPGSPYARTKVMIEMILEDMCAAYGMKGISLRYFNPIGADPKMRSGSYEEPASHIVDKLASVVNGVEEVFKITGVEYDTRDGSGIRDYIHLWDLAEAHIAAVERFDEAFERFGGDISHLVINIGLGSGITVKEFVAAFENVYGKPVNAVEAPPRPGDVAGAYANADRAKSLLNWTARLTLEQAIADALKWENDGKAMLK